MPRFDTEAKTLQNSLLLYFTEIIINYKKQAYKDWPGGTQVLGATVDRGQLCR